MSSYLKPKALHIANLLLTFTVFTISGSLSKSAQSTVSFNRQEHYNTIAAISTEDEFTDLKQSIIDGVNQYRSTKNLPPLLLNSLISQQAKTHSKNMAQGQVPFSHEGFKERVQALSGKISYRRAAENLAYNSGYAKPAKQAVEGWIDSSSHRHNMLGNYNLTGIGIAKNSQGEYYFTQIFILEK